MTGPLPAWLGNGRAFSWLVLYAWSFRVVGWVGRILTWPGRQGLGHVHYLCGWGWGTGRFHIRKEGQEAYCPWHSSTRSPIRGRSNPYPGQGVPPGKDLGQDFGHGWWQDWRCPHGKDLGPLDTPRKGPGTRDQRVPTPPPPWTDTRLWKHNLLRTWAVKIGTFMSRPRKGAKHQFLNICYFYKQERHRINITKHTEHAHLCPSLADHSRPVLAKRRGGGGPVWFLGPSSTWTQTETKLRLVETQLTHTETQLRLILRLNSEWNSTEIHWYSTQIWLGLDSDSDST